MVFVVSNLLYIILAVIVLFIIFIFRVYKYNDLDIDIDDGVNLLGFGKAEGVYLIKMGSYYLVAGMKVKSKKKAVFKFIELVEKNNYVPPRSYFKMIKIKNINNKGLTLIELIIVIAVIGILTAGGFSVYSAFVSNSEMTGVVNGIQSIQKVVGFYGQENGNYNGLNGEMLQYDKLLPNGFTYGGAYSGATVNGVTATVNMLFPPTTTYSSGSNEYTTGTYVSYYWVGAVGSAAGNALGFTAGNYIVGVDIPSLTNAQAQILCNDFSGQIQQYAYNNGTPVEPPCNIPVNDNLLNSVLYFSF